MPYVISWMGAGWDTRKLWMNTDTHHGKPSLQ